MTYGDDVATRFMGYGWNVTRMGDANDLKMLDRAFCTFKKEKDRPTLIIVDRHIAYGAPNKQDTSAAHGEPLGEEEVRLRRNDITAGRRMPDFWCQMACVNTLRRGSAHAAGRCVTHGWPSLKFTGRNILISRVRVIA